MKVYMVLAACIFAVLSCNGSCPIKKGTTKINYSQYSNSGLAILTTVNMYPDHLVWGYNEMRNECSLKDSCQYDREEFDKLISELAEIKFSAKEIDNPSSGGSGYGYSFETEKGRYFYYNSQSKMSGNYEKASNLILQFIKAHKTQCEILFEKYARMPHERAMFGEFTELPEELMPYSKR